MGYNLEHRSEKYEIKTITASAPLPFLYDEVDVAERDILDLWLGRQEGDERRGQLLDQHGDVVAVGVQHLHQLHDHLYNTHTSVKIQKVHSD